MKKAIALFGATAAICSLLVPVAVFGAETTVSGSLGGSTAPTGIGQALQGGATAELEKEDLFKTKTDFITIVANIISVILGFLGLILVAFIIYAGFLWMTDNGDEKRTETAKNILRNSIIGLIIIVVAYAISNFVVSTLATDVLKQQ